MPLRTKDCICLSSAGVGARSASPPCTATRRIVLCPTSKTAFTPMPCSSKWAFWRAMFIGLRPSWFTTAVVIPWVTRLSAARRIGLYERNPVLISGPSPWLCKSMKPGVIHLPEISKRSRAWASERSASIATMAFPWIPTSARKLLAPEPSMTVPPIRTRS